MVPSFTQPLLNALRLHGIQAAEDIIQRLIDKQEWIYPSERVNDLQEKLTKEQLYSVFNMEHHVQSATELFNFMRPRRPTSVIYGHKCQGKSQFLFFVFKLLQSVGETVLYFDRTFLNTQGNSDKILANRPTCCVNYWRSDPLHWQQSEDVQVALSQFFDDPNLTSFGQFVTKLENDAFKSKVWIVIDEVVLFKRFPIELPHEQYNGPFNFIVTGSAGIGGWVNDRHLEKYVFDLPLFSKEESFEFAVRLAGFLGKDISQGIEGIPLEGLRDWLEERFGGVIGYTAELLLALHDGKSISFYLNALKNRLKSLLGKLARDQHTTRECMSQSLLKELRTFEYDWESFTDAGLCGRKAPRGVILAMMIEILCFWATDSNELSLIQNFRSGYCQHDPGLDECLLEREEILKLKAGNPLRAALLSLQDSLWVCKGSIDLLSPEDKGLNIGRYNEELGVIHLNLQVTECIWSMIELPTGFDLIDTCLVRRINKALTIYGIQFTRSKTPFAKHNTYDTCRASSTQRMTQLVQVMKRHFQSDDIQIFYAMHAPNCEADHFRPPGGQASDILFSPAILVTSYTPQSVDRPPTTVPMRSVRKCCKCTVGKCSTCKCAKMRKECLSDCVCHSSFTSKKLKLI